MFSHYTPLSVKGDFRKVRKAAQAQGWRVVEGKETWLFYPPVPSGQDPRHEQFQPCRIGHTPSSQRTWRNFLACLRRKGYDG
jgi:hypothetical protein